MQAAASLAISRTPREAPRPTRGHSTPTAVAAPATHSSRSPSGRPASLRSADSAPCWSRAAAMPTPLGRWGSSQPTASAPRSRWRTAAPTARRGSATSSPLRTSRCAWAQPSSRRPVRPLHLLVLAQRLGLVGEGNRAGLHHVATLGNVERHQRVLLHEQDRRSLLVDLSDDLEDLLDEERREAHRRLVQHEQLRLRHQRAADRAHLLLPAGQRPGLLVPALFAVAGRG